MFKTLRKYVRPAHHKRHWFFSRDEAVLVQSLIAPAFIIGVGLAVMAIGTMPS